MARLVAILAALILIAGMSNGVMDTLWFHYSSSHYAEKANQQYWNPKISHTNKYAKDTAGNLIAAPDTWYYRTFKLKYKERYLLSATLFSFTTDAWHLFKFFYQSAWKLVVIVLGLAWFTRNHEGPKWKLIVMGLAAFVVLTIIQSIGFHITYTFIKQLMLALKVNNTYLDIDPKTAVTINLENPIFDREGIERVYSYPFQIKNNSRNIRALEFANRIDSSAKVKRPATLYLDNNPFESGILVVTGSTHKVINVTFQNEAIDLFNSLDSVQLQDFDLPVRIADDYCPDITLGGTYPSPENLKTAVALKINGLVYIGLKSNLIFMVNQINLSYPGLVSLVTLPGIPPNGGHEGIRVNCIAGIEDITVEYDFNDPLQPNEEKMDVLIIDHYLEDYANEVGTIVSTGEFQELRFPVVRMPQLYDGANPDYTGYANYINDTGDVDLTPGEIASGEPISWGTTVLPLPRLYWLLQQYGQEYGFAIGGNLWNIPEMRDDVIVWTNRPAEKLITTLDKPVVNVSTGNIRLIDAVIQVNKHLPEESIRSLISRVINTFCGFLVFRAGTLRFQLIRPLLRNRPDDWSQYADPEYTNDIQENEGYSLDYEREKGEVGIAGQLERIDGGIDAQEFIPGFYTLYDDIHTHSLGPSTFRNWLTAYTSEIGLSEAFDKSQETSFRLLFYRGIQVENNDTYYPMATHGRQNYIGEQVGDYQLSWDGEGGLLYWWEDYINLTVKGRTVTKILRLPVQEILALRNWDSVVKKIYSEFGEFSGVVKTVRFKATTTGIGEAEVTFAKL